MTSTVDHWNGLLDDVHTLYRGGVAQSIVNYVLQDEDQRTRTSLLSVPKGIPIFGWVSSIYEQFFIFSFFKLTIFFNIFYFFFNIFIFFLFLTKGWNHIRPMKVPISNALRETVSQARYDISERPAGSVLNNALLVDLIALWERYDSLLLTNLPISDIDAQKLKWSPMKWSKFEKKQIDHMTYIKNILVNEWYPKAQQILLDAAEEGIFDNTPIEVLTHFFEACASLLSRQVRFNSESIFFFACLFFLFFFFTTTTEFFKT